MNDVPLHGDLQIDQDLAFSHREWRVQRLGWLLMVLFIVGAAAGLFGGGPLSMARTGTADGRLAIEYDRIARHEGPDLLRLEIAPEAVINGTVRLWFDRAYILDRTIASISPEPERSGAADNRLVFEFHVADPARRTLIEFHTKPGAIWRQSGSAGLVGGDSLRFSQFILP